MNYYNQLQSRNLVDVNRHRLTVVGDGEVTATPDIVQITLGVRTDRENPNDAIEENARIANQIIQSLESLGIPQERIETKSYNVRPIYDFIEGKSILRGYEVEHLFDVMVTDINQVGEALSASAKAGANIVQGLQFKISNPLEYYLQALSMAVQSSSRKANHIAGQMGITLTQPPISITEIRDEPVSVFQPEGMVLAATYATTPPITTQDVVIRAKVSVVYSYS
ncbi:SIMPL domain-containing protein [Alkalihalobacterium elongatum]|uniref:SIMPL domain-containing protein n=1 Tax=Alkalihalobacterium elongatum TaxID=2675466 RepID=UPI001C1F8E43|nr:SIMPL domain-containing protein [Alkalihalobacterium elongatum]